MTAQCRYCQSKFYTAKVTNVCRAETCRKRRQREKLQHFREAQAELFPQHETRIIPAVYSGSGLFWNHAGEEAETFFVSASRRPDWLRIGKLYRLRMEMTGNAATVSVEGVT